MNRFTKKQEPASSIDELLENLYDHISELEELQEALTEAIDCYRDDSDDEISEMQLYLDDAIRDHEINEILYMELNAGRKELLRLLDILKEKGIAPSAGQYISYERLNTDCYDHDPDSPFFLDTPDKRYKELLQDQYFSLREFEERVPMTRVERITLRSHVIRDTGLQAGSRDEWEAFIKGVRARPIQ